MKRAFAFAACVVVGVTLVGSLRVSGQTKDPRIGRWQLNLSKSKFTGTPPDRDANRNECHATIEAVTKANGKVVSTFTQVVSADGKTLTYTPKDAQGKATGVVQVFDRQSTT